MKELSDEELQRFLDGLSELNADEQLANSTDLNRYEKIFDALKNEENLAGAPFGFSDKLVREAFIETERTNDLRYKIWLGIVSAFAVIASLIALTVNGVKLNIPFLNENKSMILGVIAFALVVFGLNLIASKTLNSKLKNFIF